MIQMNISDQVIAVIDDLCRKFGIAIDWTQANMLPYLNDLCQRYIKYEISTSIAWCVVSAIITCIFSITYGVTSHRYRKGESCEDAKVLTAILFWGFFITCFIVCTCQAFDIIECLTIPEKTIMDYVTTTLNRR